MNNEIIFYLERIDLLNEGLFSKRPKKPKKKTFYSDMNDTEAFKFIVPIFKKIANKYLDTDLKSSMRVNNNDESVEFNLPSVARKRNKNFSKLDFEDKEDIWWPMVDAIHDIIDKVNQEKSVQDNNLTVDSDGNFDDILYVIVNTSCTKEV